MCHRLVQHAFNISSKSRYRTRYGCYQLTTKLRKVVLDVLRSTSLESSIFARNLYECPATHRHWLSTVFAIAVILYTLALDLQFKSQTLYNLLKSSFSTDFNVLFRLFKVSNRSSSASTIHVYHHPFSSKKQLEILPLLIHVPQRWVCLLLYCLVL